MFTHSQLVDNLVAELMRPDLRVAFSNALNQTIRELHTTQDQQSGSAIPIGYVQNLYEDLLTADADVGFSYDLVNPNRFQLMEAVYYAQFGKYATERKPSTIRAFNGSVDGAEYGYYRAGNQIFFDNYGGSGAQIAIAWFEHIQRQTYYPVGSRPCQWNVETEEFDYYTVDGTDYSAPANQERAQYLCTNWMIQRWFDTLSQGVRAKIWARLADDVRGKTAYSAYQALRPQLINSETYTAGTRFRG